MRRIESDGNGSRTRSNLIDNQASFPEELATHLAFSLLAVSELGETVADQAKS